MDGKGASKFLLRLMLNSQEVVCRFLAAIRAFQFAAADGELRSDGKKIIQESSLWNLRMYKAHFAVATSQDPSRHFAPELPYV